MCLGESGEPTSSTVKISIDQRGLTEAAKDPDRTPFDYLVVGAGAGGGPLAARLALAGKKVLVIEAGPDPAKVESQGYPEAEVGEVTRVPGYYAAASEDAEMSWMFSVRHYENDARQQKDEKYNQIPFDPNTGEALDPKYLDPHPNGGKQGIFYPRSSGIGGCTAHHAMITIAPNDKDWNYIADLTGDNSWRSGPMGGYFTKLERCQYLAAYDQFLRKLLGKLLGIFYQTYRSIILIFDPRVALDDGGHGFKGWAPTNLIDPFLVSTIAKTDRPFFRVIVQAALAVLHGNDSLIAALKRALVKLRVVLFIDFNDVNTRRTNPEGVFLIPIGIEGGNGDDDEGQPGKGRRFGVREWVLTTARKYPDRLVIKSGAHVTRVLFEEGPGDKTPRAIGVECALGDHLYEASPVQKEPSGDRVCFFTKKRTGEVILCGGAFNTPQLLMLSGIGNKAHLQEISNRAGKKNACALTGEGGDPLLDQDNEPRRIHLPGVGSNLQDRYEVTVVSELNKDFDTLKGVSFKPGDSSDPARQQWLDKKSGLYATNGGTLAVIRRSKPAQETGEREPDLFTFGALTAFRGYYWNWSRELFKSTLGAREEKHRLWSWVILKAYTRNHHGTVRLRSDDPFAMPEICFDAFNEKAELEAAAIEAACQSCREREMPFPPELEERRNVNDSRVADSKRDLAALVDAVAFVRAVNARNPDQFVREIQPGSEIPNNSLALEEWIKTQAWGEQASCTCRIGADRWQPDTTRLSDRFAVLDSRFSVHGVEGLRIVDGSVFPKIPGYFIAAPILMVSEKAADTLLEESAAAVYPAAFEAAEAAAIRRRRWTARPPGLADGTGEQNGADIDKTRLPPNTVGLALSGGGMRSATFALGVLQALAERNRLRAVDILSTVSGGGFTGSFLGRLFTRNSIKHTPDPVGRVQHILSNPVSAPLWWLRIYANYVFFRAGSDYWQLAAIVWRNLFTVYFAIGMLLFAVLGVLAWLPMAIPPAPTWPQAPAWLTASPWAWLPIIALVLGVLPATFAYWLAPKAGSEEAVGASSYRRYSPLSLLAWLVLLLGALAGMVFPGGGLYAAVVILVLFFSWLWQEAARVGAGREATGGVIFKANQNQLSAIIGNRLNRGLGRAVTIFAVLLAWAVLDTCARLLRQPDITKEMIAGAVTFAGGAIPLLRWLVTRATQEISAGAPSASRLTRMANLLGIPLIIFLVLAIDVLALRLMRAYPGLSWGLVAIALALSFSLITGRAFDFLNFSSLRVTYAARLARTFLGASNEERIHSTPENRSRDINLFHPNDDLPYYEYHPEEQGGPLHFINVCLNETVDFSSGREVQDGKGLPMCVTPQGVSVGLRYFARWTTPDAFPRWQKFRRWRDGFDLDDAMPAAQRRLIALKALPVSSNPNAFHVLQTTKGESAQVESLSLGAWTSISGAAFTTGSGRDARLTLSLFLGLTNVRLGHWWDSGILPSERPGNYWRSMWQIIMSLPSRLFEMQSLLLSEWRSRFHGPLQRFWYLSDGGHFEVTGLYELLRRRVSFMILSDVGEDPDYHWPHIALLTQQVREDFGAEIEWLKPNAPVAVGWAAFPGVPPWIQNWIDPSMLGALADISRTGTHHAALGRVTYDDRSYVSWILVLKPSLSERLTEDIINYGKVNKTFPQQPTFDKVFDAAQWDRYRDLGQQITRQVIR